MGGAYLQIDLNRLERSDTKLEDIRKRRAELSQQGFEGYREGERNSNCNTRHQVGADGGGGDGTIRLMERQHRDQGLAGEKNHQGNPYATEFRIQGMSGGGREPTLEGGFHCLELREGMGG